MNMGTNEPITKYGYDKIQNELDQLVRVDREELKVIIALNR